MKPETKTHSNNSVQACQNCKRNFTIESEDFNFYEKIKVPPPTFCPECRLQRRLAWRNERNLFKTICQMCKKSIFSGYPADTPLTIFCWDCWYSDRWNPLEFGQDYNFSKPFFEQFKELLNKVPKASLFLVNCVNSDYSNIIRDCKNAYLSHSAVNCENVYYSKNIDDSREIFDSLSVVSSERCGYLVFGVNNYDTFSSIFVRSCLNSYFLFDCVNCSDCFMSSNLRNQKYFFRNKKYIKEEYEKLLQKEHIHSFARFEGLMEEFEVMCQKAIHKYAEITRSVNATGHILNNVKNTHNCFEVYDAEDVKFISRAFEVKDSYDLNNTYRAELLYEYGSGGRDLNKVFFSLAFSEFAHDVFYSGWCRNVSNLFGCLGVRDKSYCILNKQYTKEEYEKMFLKIVEHMKTMPFIGKNNRAYKFGEFLPIELSPFAYNESDAQELFPLSLEEIKNKGYNYRVREKKKNIATINSTNLPDSIKDTTNTILQEAIECPHQGECLHQCTSAFKIISEELRFYQMHNLPLPRLCPNCRHFKRLGYRNVGKLWHSSCMCEKDNHSHGTEKCKVEFETPYAPERPEIVYCEKCYQQEVY